MRKNFIKQWNEFKSAEVSLTKDARKILNEMGLSNFTFKTPLFIYGDDGYSYNLENVSMQDEQISFNCEDGVYLSLDDISWETMMQIVLAFCENN